MTPSEEESIESLAFNAALAFANALSTSAKSPKAFGEAVRAAYEAVKRTPEETSTQ
jgi:hypothetical protein